MQIPNEHYVLNPYKHYEETTMKKILLPAVLLLSSSLAMAAGTAVSTLDVSATVGSVCAVSTSPVNFGAYDYLLTSNAFGSVTVTCNAGTTYTIDLDGGMNGDRQLTDGAGNYIDYELYDSVSGLVWGDGHITVMADPVSATSTGIDTFTVDGQVLAGAMVPDGVYGDIVNVVVNY